MVGPSFDGIEPPESTILEVFPGKLLRHPLRRCQRYDARPDVVLAPDRLGRLCRHGGQKPSKPVSDYGQSPGNLDAQGAEVAGERTVAVLARVASPASACLGDNPSRELPDVVEPIRGNCRFNRRG